MRWWTLCILVAVVTWYSPVRCARRVDAHIRATESMQKRSEEDLSRLMRRSHEETQNKRHHPSLDDEVIEELRSFLRRHSKDHNSEEESSTEDNSSSDDERTVNVRFKTYKYEKRNEPDAKKNVNTLFKLTKDEHMTPVVESKDATGTTTERLQEYYRDIPVYDAVVTVRTDKQGDLTGDASGTIIQEIDSDLPDITADLTDEETLEIALKAERDTDKRKDITDITYKRWVYMDDSGKARLVNTISYLIDGIKRPQYIIDVKNGEVLNHWNAFTTLACGKRTYKAYGGNKKEGRIKYGDLPYCLDMKIDHETGTCYLENDYVRVVDMKNSTKSSIQQSASFKCKNGYDDRVNGAYSPATDVFFYGTLVWKMFDEWFGETPLKDQQIVMRVHFDELYMNAFWNGDNCTFGDGSPEMMYPLTTLDVVGHEIAHGTTEFSSGLIYAGESGGINEAFSDMVGEAAEDYLLSSDLFIGKYVMKRLPYFREFETPENDNNSISHVDDMTGDMDPHFSSGVYRRVWYVLVKQKNVPVRDALHVFYRANKMYWHHNGTFYDCSCGALRAAIDLGLSTTPFRRAFTDVGIADCDVASHIFHLANNITQHDVTVSDTVQPVFRFESPVWGQDVIVSAKSDSGKDIKIVVQNGTWESQEDFEEDVNVVAEGYNDVVVHDVAETTLYIRLVSDDLATQHHVDVEAGYTCNSNFSSDSYLEEAYYKWYCYGIMGKK